MSQSNAPSQGITSDCLLQLAADGQLTSMSVIFSMSSADIKMPRTLVIVIGSWRSVIPTQPVN